MRNKAILFGVVLSVGLGGLAASSLAMAGGPFNMFNPTKWFDNDNNHDDYYYDRYRHGGPYGWGGGPYGGYPGAYGYGWGGPYGGYPYGGYGPGYMAPQQSQPSPPPIPE